MAIETSASRVNRNNPERTKENFENEAFRFIEPVWQAAIMLAESDKQAVELTETVFAKAYKSWTDSEQFKINKLQMFKLLAWEVFGERYHLEEKPRFDENSIISRRQLPQDQVELKAVSCRVLGEVVAGIPKDVRFVVMLSLRWGFSYREIAEIIGSNPETIRRKMLVGRNRLSETLIGNLYKSSN
jgi:hypothetical protein